MNLGNGLTLEIGKYQKRVDTRLKLMQKANVVGRVWKKDRSLFVEEGNTSDVLMGWLDLPDRMLGVLPEINEFCKNIRNEGFNHVVLLGMGGSSLAPLVFQKTFGNSENGLSMTVLDTTEPEIIKQVENSINIPTTLFIVSSKSGNTAEVMAFYEYFYYRVSNVKRERAGENFIAITDEGSPLVQLAAKKKFRKTFINFNEIGGRYSALSFFGIVPATLIGLNVKEILLRAKAMAVSCGPLVPAEENSAFVLGAAMTEMSSKGCEKLTYMMPEELGSFGLWLEQLIAESTGKEGKGILPFNGYPLAKRGSYGKDRFFVQYGFCGEQNDLQSVQPSDLLSLKYPFINILIKDELDLGKEFFRWELATAVAGMSLGLNPFDQPNVQESKKCTDAILKKVEKEKRLPRIEPALIENSIVYYAENKKHNAKQLIEELMATSTTGDYLAIQAYLPETPSVEMYLNEIHKTFQENLKLAVTTQYGPRYLHSTGQYHKGGTNNGYFIQLVCSSSVDINIPEHEYTFGMLKRAQAIGDREALMQHGRKVIMIDLGEDFVNNLRILKKVVDTVKSTDPEGKIAPAGKIKGKMKQSVMNTAPEAVVLIHNQTGSDAAKASA